MPAREDRTGESEVVLHGLPLGTGGHLIRFCGGLWERIEARRQKRQVARLFHAALELVKDGVSWFVELAPALNPLPEERSVAGNGPVGRHGQAGVQAT